MPLAGQAVEAEIGFDGLQVGGEPDGHALLLGFPDVSAGGLAQTFEEPVRPWGEVEEVVGITAQSAGRRARSGLRNERDERWSCRDRGVMECME